jgi:hypothetical protein
MEQPYAPPPVRPGYNLALASMIVGICGVVLGCCGPFLGVPLGIVAIVLGVMATSAMTRAEGQEDSGRTMAIVGIVLGVLATLVGIGSAIWSLFFFKSFMRQWPGGPGMPPGMPRMPH